MKKEIDKLNIPPIREFLQTIHDAGGEIYGCKASVDMFHLKKEDFTPLVDDIITVGEFYEKIRRSADHFHFNLGGVLI